MSRLDVAARLVIHGGVTEVDLTTILGEGDALMEKLGAVRKQDGRATADRVDFARNELFTAGFGLGNGRRVVENSDAVKIDPAAIRSKNVAVIEKLGAVGKGNLRSAAD